MTCPTCNEDIIEGQETAACEFCQKRVHKSCIATRRDPIDEHVERIYPSLVPANKQEFCYLCYEVRAMIVRDAMMGEAAYRKRDPEVARERWRRKYRAILDAFPVEPQQDDGARDCVLDVTVDRLLPDVTEQRKVG